MFRNTRSLTESVCSFSVFSYSKVNWDVDQIWIDPLESPVINESLENNASEDKAAVAFVLVIIKKLLVLNDRKLFELR